MTVSSGSYTVRISSNDPRTDYGIFPGNPPTTRISRDGNIMITFNDEPEAPKFTFFNSSGNEVGYSYAPSAIANACGMSAWMENL